MLDRSVSNQQAPESLSTKFLNAEDLRAELRMVLQFSLARKHILTVKEANKTQRLLSTGLL
jgi:hypothetical protein